MYSLSDRNTQPINKDYLINYMSLFLDATIMCHATSNIVIVEKGVVT
jgi:hypothetical protein